MNIKTMTDTELKALAYEQVRLLSQTQQNISLIENELALRAQQEKITVEQEA